MKTTLIPNRRSPIIVHRSISHCYIGEIGKRTVQHFMHAPHAIISWSSIHPLVLISSLIPLSYEHSLFVILNLN